MWSLDESSVILKKHIEIVNSPKHSKHLNDHYSICTVIKTLKVFNIQTYFTHRFEPKMATGRFLKLLCICFCRAH